MVLYNSHRGNFLVKNGLFDIVSGAAEAFDTPSHALIDNRFIPSMNHQNHLVTQLTTIGYTMPVHLENHNPDIDLKPGTTKSAIVEYLYQNSEWGYSPAEIKDTLDIPRGTATTTLKRLYDEGYLGKTEDGYYHALADREGVRRYVSSLDQVSRMFGHHRDESATPEIPEKQIGESLTDEELNAELKDLENETVE